MFLIALTSIYAFIYIYIYEQQTNCGKKEHVKGRSLPSWRKHRLYFTGPLEEIQRPYSTYMPCIYNWSVAHIYMYA